MCKSIHYCVCLCVCVSYSRIVSQKTIRSKHGDNGIPTVLIVPNKLRMLEWLKENFGVLCSMFVGKCIYTYTNTQTHTVYNQIDREKKLANGMKKRVLTNTVIQRLWTRSHSLEKWVAMWNDGKHMRGYSVMLCDCHTSSIPLLHIEPPITLHRKRSRSQYYSNVIRMCRSRRPDTNRWIR